MYYVLRIIPRAGAVHSVWTHSVQYRVYGALFLTLYEALKCNKAT